MKLSSSSFSDGGTIPDPHALKSKNISPDLMWENAPAGAKSFSLIVDDPDSHDGNCTHWVAYNITAKSALPANVPAKAFDGLLQGKNDFGWLGYGGPCPPRGDGSHRYHFRLYALDDVLDLPPGATRDEVEKAMTGHVLDSAQITGRYEVALEQR